VSRREPRARYPSLQGMKPKKPGAVGRIGDDACAHAENRVQALDGQDDQAARARLNLFARLSDRRTRATHLSWMSHLGDSGHPTLHVSAPIFRIEAVGGM
jgi:hypothetical protein